jgi:hypothetical protein
MPLSGQRVTHSGGNNVHASGRFPNDIRWHRGTWLHEEHVGAYNPCFGVLLSPWSITDSRNTGIGKGGQMPKSYLCCCGTYNAAAAVWYLHLDHEMQIAHAALASLGFWSGSC